MKVTGPKEGGLLWASWALCLELSMTGEAGEEVQDCRCHAKAWLSCRAHGLFRKAEMLVPPLAPRS